MVPKFLTVSVGGYLRNLNFFFFSFYLWPHPQFQATAAGLHHSHSNTGSLTHWARQGMQPSSSWSQRGVLNMLSHRGTPQPWTFIWGWLFPTVHAMRWNFSCFIPANGKIFGPFFLLWSFFPFLQHFISIQICSSFYLAFPAPVTLQVIEDFAFWLDIHLITLQLPLPLAIWGKEWTSQSRKCFRQENVIKFKVWQGNKWGKRMRN